MSEAELYEIAQRRIDRRNRRWILWSINLGGLILCVALLILLGSTTFVKLGAAFFMAWAGVFVLHTIVLGITHSRERDIDGELAKLRTAVAASDYEKPKRVELSDDGELVEFPDWEQDNAQQRLRS